MDFKKTVVITGASGDIGSTIARRYAKEGCSLVLTCCNNEPSLKKLCAEPVFADCDILTWKGDLSVSENVSQLFQRVRERFGHVDILINNAGVSYVGLITDMSDEDWKKIIDTNLGSVFYCCRATIPGMVSAKKGCIINISSVWGEYGASCEAAYSASKGGVNAFTKALAKELAPSGINVNAVACGYIDTRMNSHLSPEEAEELCNEIPAGRAGTPDEVADLVYAISCQSPYLTGQIITFDGGWM